MFLYLARHLSGNTLDSIMTTSPTLSQETRLALEKILRALEVFRSDDRDMPIGEAVSFLSIALSETKEGGMSVTELSKLGDFSLASASRHAQALGKFDRRRDPGLEWIEDSVDLMERRKKILKVTAQGRRIVAQLQAAIAS